MAISPYDAPIYDPWANVTGGVSGTRLEIGGSATVGASVLRRADDAAVNAAMVAMQALGQVAVSQAAIASAMATARAAARDAWRNTAGTDQGYENREPGIFDRVAAALSPLTNVGQIAAGVAAETKANLNALLDTAKAAARAGGAGAAAALKLLADNGDFFAKIALGFGVGYAAATAMLVAGGAVVLVLLLKK